MEIISIQSPPAAARNGSSGRAYVLPVMFFSFMRQPNLRGPSADRRETLPHDRNLAEIAGKGLKIFGGRSQKHAKFRSIFCNV